MKKVLLLFVIIFYANFSFSQKDYNFESFLNYFPELNLPITSNDFEKFYHIKTLDTTFVAQFIDDSKIKYYTIHQDSETGEVTFEGFVYYDYRPFGKILFNKNIWWIIYSLDGEDVYNYRYLSSYDIYGDRFDTLLIGLEIDDSVSTRFIIDKNKNIKVFFYYPYISPQNQSKIIIKTYKMNEQNKFFIYQTDSLITNHNFYDYFNQKIDGDPFYNREE